MAAPLALPQRETDLPTFPAAPDQGLHSRAPSPPTMNPCGPPASAPTLSSRTSEVGSCPVGGLTSRQLQGARPAALRGGGCGPGGWRVDLRLGLAGKALDTLVEAPRSRPGPAAGSSGAGSAAGSWWPSSRQHHQGRFWRPVKLRPVLGGGKALTAHSSTVCRASGQPTLRGGPARSRLPQPLRLPGRPRGPHPDALFSLGSSSGLLKLHHPLGLSHVPRPARTPTDALQPYTKCPAR